MAKNLVAAGIADEILVQISYAIGMIEPISININTYGTSKLDLSDDEIAASHAHREIAGYVRPPVAGHPLCGASKLLGC